LVDALEEQRLAGRVERLGVSIYDAADARTALSHANLNVTQYSFNVLNTRVVTSGFADQLHSAGHELFARSSLSQGLLMLSPERGEGLVPGAGVWLERFRQICAAHGASPLASAIGYAAAESRARYIVLGVESGNQLREAVSALRTPVAEELVADLRAGFDGVPVSVGDPRRWRGAA
jgi:aryl-alcohol dehydrogenase-like predicted oxidoreductase